VPSSHLVKQLFLETERLVLRRFTESDVDRLVELDSDPAVMRFLTGGRPTSRAVVRDEVLPKILGYYEDHDGLGYWAAEEKSTGNFIGWFALEPTKGPDNVELGYRLRRAAWGRGYATEGATALVHKAFTELGVQRVYAETMAVNTASRRVMTRAGLRYRRTFHLSWPETIPGTEQGDVEYALTRAEFDGPQPLDGPAAD
jgi:RimJ/RimL family protein N-acetyltransferase